MKSNVAEKEAGCVNTQPNRSQVESTTTLTAEQLFSQSGRAFVVEADATGEVPSTKPKTFEDIVRTIEPGAGFGHFMSVYQSWFDTGKAPRTVAQAQEIAAAIIAEYGGTVTVRYFLDSQTEGAVHVITWGIDIAIYFDSPEATP